MSRLEANSRSCKTMALMHINAAMLATSFDSSRSNTCATRNIDPAWSQKVKPAACAPFSRQVTVSSMSVTLTEDATIESANSSRLPDSSGPESIVEYQIRHVKHDESKRSGNSASWMSRNSIGNTSANVTPTVCPPTFTNSLASASSSTLWAGANSDSITTGPEPRCMRISGRLPFTITSACAFIPNSSRNRRANATLTVASWMRRFCESARGNELSNAARPRSGQ